MFTHIIMIMIVHNFFKFIVQQKKNDWNDKEYFVIIKNIYNVCNNMSLFYS